MADADFTDAALTEDVDSNDVTLCTPPFPEPGGVSVLFPMEEAKVAAVEPPTYPIVLITLLVAESFRSLPLWVKGPGG